MNVLTNLNLNQNELQNWVMHPLATAPANPREGLTYYNSTDKMAYQYRGAEKGWVVVGDENIIEIIKVNGTAQTVTGKAVDITMPVASTDNPAMDGTAAPGTGATFARADHVHPHDTSKLDLAGGTMSGPIAMGDNKITGLSNGTNASDAAAFGQIPTPYASAPVMDGVASTGGSANWARGDHVHPTDTSRMAALLKGAANGVAELDANGKVPASQLPSFVDDVIEGYLYNSKFYKEAAHTTEITGETGKIYVDLSTELTYRWSGSVFAEISQSLALGETESTAYRGDRGKTAYDHSQVTSGNPHSVTKSDVGLGNCDNTSDATKKTNFTGSIADGNTGFATGGDVYSAVTGLIKKATGTISTSATSATVNYSGTLINAYATMDNDIVHLDITVGVSSVTFATAAAPASAVTCVVIYA